MQKFNLDMNDIKIETTLGRIIFNDILPKDMPFINKQLGKKDLIKLVYDCYTNVGNYETVLFLDRLKDLGLDMLFKVAYQYQ